ncbi:hypothetical protein FRB93_003856 [Tulasnella sp. JGI-2019a]|nr:hypothetical protein FRB93_003856 [Tulasnella sp. JGI-2019a]
MREFAEFARPLQDQDIASPNEIVRAEHAPVMWTQRASFATTPPAFITMIMPDLGVPTAEEVVQYLEVLATEIAPQFPLDDGLLDDLVETYDWLLAHIDDTKRYLSQRRASLLWLNVIDPRDKSTPWTWRSGRQLIFDLRFDNPKREHYDVKDFLAPYRDLLLCSGAHEQDEVTLPDDFALEDEMNHGERLHLGWRDLRQNDWLTDIQFEVDGEVIRAHRGVLAAAMNHFRVALTGGYQEGEVTASPETPMVFPTTGITSAFAMQSVIESGPALEDLLALLDLSNMWMVDELKSQTQKAIVDLKLVRLETYRAIQERAEACNATALVAVCRQKHRDVSQWS